MRKWDEHANYVGYLNGVAQRRVYTSIELQQMRKGLAIASPLELCVPPSHGSGASWNPHLLEINQDHPRRRRT
jgi:hypothetical protein